MLCDTGIRLRHEYDQAHRQVEIAAKERLSEPPNHHQSESRWNKAHEVERGAANVLEQHVRVCGTCRETEATN